MSILVEAECSGCRQERGRERERKREEREREREREKSVNDENGERKEYQCWKRRQEIV